MAAPLIRVTAGLPARPLGSSKMRHPLLLTVRPVDSTCDRKMISLASNYMATPQFNSPRLAWGLLLHLSFNMWFDRPKPLGDIGGGPQPDFFWGEDRLRFDESLWRDVTQRMSDVGMNMVVIDLGDGVRYRTHPEIGVPGAWSVAKLQDEIARLRGLGLEPIPKLNFSTTHDLWLGPYARQVSSPAYYRGCSDLIAEVCELFGGPRLFHLGYDEETLANQRYSEYVVIRQHDLWWRDFQFFVGQVERAGARPWIWSDYGWHHEEAFFARMPRSVLQSNWHYDLVFSEEDVKGPADPKEPHGRQELYQRFDMFRKLEAHGYDQIPTGSNFRFSENFDGIVKSCLSVIRPDRLLGFLHTTWHPTQEAYRAVHLAAVDQVAAAMKSAKRSRHPA